jgi:formate dehydrogenase subunit gamma
MARRPYVERNNRRTRWFHAAVYVIVLCLLATGLWLLAGREGDRSPLAALFGTADTTLHKDAGWALIAIAVVGVLLGRRGVRTFVRESPRRPDLRQGIPADPPGRARLVRRLAPGGLHRTLQAP